MTMDIPNYGLFLRILDSNIVDIDLNKSNYYLIQRIKNIENSLQF